MIGSDPLFYYAQVIVVQTIESVTKPDTQSDTQLIVGALVIFVKIVEHEAWVLQRESSAYPDGHYDTQSPEYVTFLFGESSIKCGTQSLTQ